ncbi:hypothetical protein AcV5_001813 [Taiwanofungus camphoratus]|nr:hypothetical protein AcV5_001813 [Antrodia cinnamomea]
MSIFVGNVRAADPSDIKHIARSREARELRNGDLIQIFDYILEWDDDCVSEDLSQMWRTMGDPLCDNALHTVFPSSSSSVGKELLACLESFSAQHPDSESVRVFLDEVSQDPPPGLGVTAEQVALAREFFLDNSLQIVQALLHFSLAGGFASPRIVRTLRAVSYLVPHSGSNKRPSSTNIDTSHASTGVSSRITEASNERTFQRLLETFQFVLDVLGCTAAPSTPPSPDSGSESTKVESTKAKPPDAVAYLLPGGSGWRSTVNVRLLHGISRTRVRERWRREAQEDFESDGVLISQEDLSATLAAFSTIPIFCLRRLHLPPSPAHASAYLALWRHVGFYLGVSPSILSRYFSDTSTADKFIATTALLHLFSTDDFDASDAPTIPILRAASNRPPAYTSFEHHCALARHLLGPSLASHLGVGPPSLMTSLRLHGALLMQRLPHWFAWWYPRKGWATKRRALMREGIARTVRWYLGMRRVTFRPRTDINSHASQDGDSGGQLAPGVKEAESVPSDPAGVKTLVRQWQEVLAEMISVCTIVGLAGVGVTCIGMQWAWSGISTHWL